MKKLFYSFFAIYITCTVKAQDAVEINPASIPNTVFSICLLFSSY